MKRQMAAIVGLILLRVASASDVSPAPPPLLLPSDASLASALKSTPRPVRAGRKALSSEGRFQKLSTVRAAQRSLAVAPRRPPSVFDRMGFDIQFGALGRRNSTFPGFLGMQYLSGGRITADIRMSERWYLRPSVGYFTGSQGEAAVTVSEQDVEAGLSVDYALVKANRFLILGGLAGRMDMLFSRISVLGQTGSGPMGLSYRVGPELATQVALSRSIGLAFSVETGSTLDSPARMYAEGLAGLVFRFK